METSSNSGTLQWLLWAVLLSDVHESWHLVLSELDFLSAKSGEGDICDLVGGLLGRKENRHRERRNVREVIDGGGSVGKAEEIWSATIPSDTDL